MMKCINSINESTAPNQRFKNSRKNAKFKLLIAVSCYDGRFKGSSYTNVAYKRRFQLERLVMILLRCCFKI